jgi:hypothetical protein
LSKILQSSLQINLCWAFEPSLLFKEDMIKHRETTSLGDPEGVILNVPVLEALVRLLVVLLPLDLILLSVARAIWLATAPVDKESSCGGKGDCSDASS